MPFIDLNCDLGESFGAYTIGMDAEILPYVTSANIVCGFHAGDPSVMQKSVLLCKKYGVQVGAHPGLPDLQGFGRRRMAISTAEAEADGSLVPRGAPGAMIEDEDTAIARVLQMAAQGTVQADDGSTVTLQADSVCVHGDGPKALAFVQKISAALLAAGTAVAAF